jgi:hypothetical protein
MASQGWRFPCLQLLVLFAAASAMASAAVPAPSAPAAPIRTLLLDGLGKDAVPLDGPWQFHLGDNPAWAAPSFDDSQWEQLTADKTWGAQTHPSYTGFAWYRRAITITPAPGVKPDFSLLIPHIDDVYEIYWNGKLVGQLGSMPPHLVEYVTAPWQIYSLNPGQQAGPVSGVLAIRVFKGPLASNDPADLGGFEALPLLGSPAAIAAAKGSRDFRWLRSQQFLFGLTSLYALVALLSFIAWVRDRSQWLLFWMTILAFCPAVDLLTTGMRQMYPFNFQIVVAQTFIEIRETSQWFLLLWLLQIHEYRKLVRFARIAATISIVSGALDSLSFSFFPNLISEFQFQIVDAFFTCCALPFEVVPAILVTFAILRHKRLDSSRWLVAIIAFLNATTYWLENLFVQGVRITHFTINERINAPLITINGNALNILLILRTLLFLSIVYAVIRYVVDTQRRQTSLEQEFQNARELQQVLVPETLPTLAGFTLTSAYRPAQEVGGDFFQIIPVENGSTLVVLGDVSGKGLKAAMAVSMIVGAVRTLVENTSSPAEILAGINRRLIGRLQGGFATAIALRLDGNGACTIASAGHPAPYVNDQELTFPGALPLGVMPTAVFEELRFNLGERDQLALYTDGLLEARSQSGDLYSFGRLKTLFATRPTAEQAAQAAVNFGQDDDITVLTLTRMTANA